MFGKVVARPKGFEPLTPRFVVWCSIQLSYGRLPAFFTATQKPKAFGERCHTEARHY
jgi:hypothetical protein